MKLQGLLMEALTRLSQPPSPGRAQEGSPPLCELKIQIRNAGDLNNELMLGIFCKVLSLFLKLGKQQLSEYFFIHVLFCNHQPV